jgi:glyoxylase-like metal-dependent hydrolase (beta-lactamase superfamily II)
MARERQLFGGFYGQSWKENGACGAGHPTKRAKHSRHPTDKIVTSARLAGIPRNTLCSAPYAKRAPTLCEQAKQIRFNEDDALNRSRDFSARPVSNEVLQIPTGHSVHQEFTPRNTIAMQGESPVVIIRNAAATAKINVTKLRSNVSVLEGSGGNIVVLTGRDGKLLVDAGITASRSQITEALATLSDDPVKHLINTHWHFDHTDGNEWLHCIGAEITAHENTRKHLSVTTRVEDWNFTFPSAPAGALPTKLFDSEQTLHLNGATLALKYYPPAHTDSDISVHFTDADIIHVADTLWNGHFPFIDYSTGGSIDGMIRAAEANIARVSGKTIVIPGHGPIGNKSQLIEFRDMLVSVREKVSTLKKEGKSLEEVVAARPTADYDAKWGGFVIDGNFFTRLVYAGV